MQRIPEEHAAFAKAKQAEAFKTMGHAVLAGVVVAGVYYWFGGSVAE